MLERCLCFLCLFPLAEHAACLVKGGIVGVKVLAVHLVLRDAQGVAEMALSNRQIFRSVMLEI